jgi:hypothetical protein
MPRILKDSKDVNSKARGLFNRIVNTLLYIGPFFVVLKIVQLCGHVPT